MEEARWECREVLSNCDIYGKKYKSSMSLGINFVLASWQFSS